LTELKSKSAGGIRRKFDWVRKAYWKEHVVFSTRFFLSTVGVDKKVILNYEK
jgi:REP element-mobilizing transposase RayT